MLSARGDLVAVAGAGLTAFFQWVADKPVLAWLCGVATLVYLTLGIAIRWRAWIRGEGDE